jgi:CheY-like chemotaxis protein
MVVDDDDDLRATLAEALDIEGYRVISASNGQQALDLLRGGLKPALVLLDLWMPEMDGWQVRHAMQSDPELEGIPIVIMTAAQGQDPASLQVSSVLQKPVGLTQLIETVERFY